MPIPKPIWNVLLFFGAIYVTWNLATHLVWGTGTSGPSSETFRYKLTINVTVDGTPYSASSVIEATQRLADCPSWGFSGIGSGRCMRRFTARGAAPMIHLPDGAVVFASLSGRVDRTNNTGGQAASRLPWLIYVDEWWAGLDRSQYKNLPIVELPENPPRIEIPFEGHPLSEMRPPIWFIPPQELGPPFGYIAAAGKSRRYEKRALKLDNFSIEPTDSPIQSDLTDVPSWMAAYRGGPKISETERRRRIDLIVRSDDPRSSPALTSIIRN